jgi:hypothetical protein
MERSRIELAGDVSALGFGSCKQRGHEQAPAVALAGLCESFPEHEDWRELPLASVASADVIVDE